MKIKELIKELEKLDGEKTISGIKKENYDNKEYYSTHTLFAMENKFIEDLCIEGYITFDEEQNVKADYYI